MYSYFHLKVAEYASRVFFKTSPGSRISENQNYFFVSKSQPLPNPVSQISLHISFPSSLSITAGTSTNRPPLYSSIYYFQTSQNRLPLTPRVPCCFMYSVRRFNFFYVDGIVLKVSFQKFKRGFFFPLGSTASAGIKP